jgi:hypothetical protein
MENILYRVFAAWGISKKAVTPTRFLGKRVPKVGTPTRFLVKRVPKAGTPTRFLVKRYPPR